MAADKKKASEKAGIKKTGTKIKVSAQKNDPCPPIDPANIIVPKGGQVIQYYKLLPKLPVEKKKGKPEAQDWDLIPEGSDTPIEGDITIGFHENARKLERVFEQAILVIQMEQTVSGGTWRFALGGIATDQADSDPDNDIKVEIIDNGLTMLVFVHVIPEESTANIGFRYVASFADDVSGIVKIYESTDPGFVPIRPIG